MKLVERNHQCDSNCVKNYIFGEPPYECIKAFEELELSDWSQNMINWFWQLPEINREKFYMEQKRLNGK